jgi:hypothetical protein
LEDVNGDGKKDLVTIGGAGTARAGRVYVALSDGKGYPTWNWSSAARMVNDADAVSLADVNGDGKVDFVARGAAQAGNAGILYVALSNGTGFPSWNWNSATRKLNDADTMWLADVNGDGKADLVARGGPVPVGKSGYMYVSLSNGTGFPDWTWCTTARMLNDSDSMWLADMNGDKKADLVARGGPGAGGNEGYTYISLSNGTGFSAWDFGSIVRTLNPGDIMWLADVNGDKKADLVAQVAPNTPTSGCVFVGLHDDPVYPSGDLADEAVFDNNHCSGSLLTNNWVVSVQHCAYNNGYIMYNKPCATDADCSARGATCIPGHGYCGTTVKAHVNNPYSQDVQGDGDQFNLFQLSAPIGSSLRSGRHSIAQPVYWDKRETLLNKTITVLGTASVWPKTAMGTYRVTAVKETLVPHLNAWYELTSLGSTRVIGGDSGGPGYLTVNGVSYLTGATNSSDGNEGGNFVTQPDAMYVSDWLDQTLFDTPKSIQTNVGSFSMALTPSGAVQAFTKYGIGYISRCNVEPCDSRGAWSTPREVMGGTNLKMAIAADGTEAQVFVSTPPSVRAFTMTSNGGTSGADLGGSCAGPIAADSVPNTNPPIIDVVCTTTDGNLSLNQRVNGSYTGWSSIGKPTVGIMAGTAPAIVSTEGPYPTIRVVVVGSDGQAWMRIINSRGGWTSLGGVGLRSVAIASYRSARYDVFAVDSAGTMKHRIFEGGLWPAWISIGQGYSTTIPPFAAAFAGKLGVMNVGGVDPSGNARVQRYGDW